jgi:hypothetical protein
MGCAAPLLEPLPLPIPSGKRLRGNATQSAPKERRRFTVRDLPANAPRHCHHCHSLGARDWWIWVWPENSACQTKMRVPYKCASWRCPDCAVHEAHVCWTRMRDAFQPLDPSGMVFMVLTLDRCGTYSGEKRWKNAQAAYRELGKLQTELMWRLRRWQKRNGWDVLQNQWVSTVEMHKSGWPHMNLVLWSPQLADWLRTERAAKLDDGLTEIEANLVSRELADIVTDAGWGLRSTAECARTPDAALGYICKVSGKVDETIGELAKLTQLPNAAPFRFRRLRSGRGFLPPRNSNPQLTGTLVRRQNSNDGTRDVLPLHNVRPDLVASSEEACATEERIWYQELETAHRCARQVKQFGMRAVELPPVTRWFKYRRLDNAAPARSRHERDDYIHSNEERLFRSAIPITSGRAGPSPIVQGRASDVQSLCGAARDG